LSSIISILLLSLLFVFTGCTKKIYSSNVYKKYRTTYSNVAPQKIKNSKAMHRATMRSYVVMGKRYYPTRARVGDKFSGIASWYGPKFHSKLTSNGEIYNMYAMTAAHKTLPMNTMVKVYNKENGKSVIVRINDRGPFVAGRIIDLSNVAARKIDMVKKGTADVRITILGFNAKIARTKSQRQEVATLGKFYLQVGAFKRLEGAETTKRKFKLILDDEYDVIIKQTDLNRVWISGFRSEDEANDFKSNNRLKGAVVIAQ
jgi:rare lipoprotein A